MKKSFNKKKLIALCVALALFIALLATILISFIPQRVSREISVDEAYNIVFDTFKELPRDTLGVASQKVADSLELTVNSVDFGANKDVIVDCTYSVIDIKTLYNSYKTDMFNKVCTQYFDDAESGNMSNATALSISLFNDINDYFVDVTKITGDVKLKIYETSKGVFSVYLSDETVNALTGGGADVLKDIKSVSKVNYNGVDVDITNNNTIRTSIEYLFGFDNYSSSEPAIGNFIRRWCLDFASEFERNFIENDHWIYLVQGLCTTLAITCLAGIMGIILGFVVAIIRCTNETTGKFYFIDRICRLYLTVVRGTPVMVQLLIIYFVILLPIGLPKFISAVLCFGLNSGAYVAEIVRGGIMSVDKGQMEAGRSLGFNYAQSMIHFIVPQAFKAVLPSLANEFITLLKESSVAFYIGVADLTQGGLKIRSITYSNFMPLVAVALIYLVIVLVLTKLVGLLERRLRKSEH